VLAAVNIGVIGPVAPVGPVIGEVGGRAVISEELMVILEPRPVEIRGDNISVSGNGRNIGDTGELSDSRLLRFSGGPVIREFPIAT
jgi:hypothetical protein